MVPPSYPRPTAEPGPLDREGDAVVVGRWAVLKPRAATSMSALSASDPPVMATTPPVLPFQVAAVTVPVSVVVPVSSKNRTICTASVAGEYERVRGASRV